MRSRNMLFAAVLLPIVLLSAFSLLFKERILLAIGDYLVVQDELQPVDVIHVIAGEDYRTEYAIQLYKQGYAKYLFFTGGWCQSHGYYHGEHGKQLALDQGVPPEAIAFDDSRVTSTYSETAQLKTWIDQNSLPVQSVIVVSDPFHMRRSQWIYRMVLGEEMEIIMAPVPFEHTPYKRQWWIDGESLRYVSEEYIKSFYYLFRYQVSWGFIRDWLASLDQN